MMMLHNRTPFILCLVGGTLLILSGASGSIGLLDELVEGLTHLFGPDFVLTFAIIIGILSALMIIAGALVIVSGVVMTTHHVEIGRILLLVAVVMGVVGLIAGLAQSVISGIIVIDMNIQIMQSLGWLGAIFSVVARIIAEQKHMVDH